VNTSNVVFEITISHANAHSESTLITFAMSTLPYLSDIDECVGDLA
jgi:hypothetical protein